MLSPRQRETALALAPLMLATYPLILPIFRSDLQRYLGVGLETYGLLLSIPFLPASATAFVTGLAVDRYSPRLAMRVASLVLASGALLLVVPIPSFPLFLAALILARCGMSGLNVALQSRLTRLYPHDRRRILSLQFAAVGLSWMTWPLLGEWLLSLQDESAAVSFGDVLHWPFAALGAVFLLVGLRRPAPSRVAEEAPASTTASGRLKPLPSGVGLPLLLAMLILHGSFDNTANIWLPRVLESASFDSMPIKPGTVASGFALVYVVSRLLITLLPERTGRRVMLMLPGLLGGGIFLAGVLSRSYLGTAAGYVCGAMCWSAEMPTALAEASRQSKERFGTVISIQLLGAGTGAFLVSSGIGLLGERLPDASLWQVLLLPAGGFVLVGLIGAAWVWRYSGRAAPV
jgi:MFS family permease